MSPPAIIALVLSIVSAGTLFVALWSMRWPRTKGVVDVSIFDADWEVESTSRGASVEKRGRFYLAYSYTVDGIVFQRSRISPLIDVDWQLSGSPGFSGARDRAHRYREGSAVDVWYCPFLPGWACLEPGGFMPALLFAAAAVISFLFI